MARIDRRNAHDRIFKRELGGPSRYTNIKGLYGDRRWVKDLDIINELDGHTGCVNALSWSKNGNLLASGSDDQHINIHEYLSDTSPTSFKLATTIATGHTANIFSVKFMPHSGDKTLVSCAGDKQIRVFDIEYSGRSAGPNISDVRSSARAQGMVHKGVRYLGESDTNARVYRSHSDRVKRIVTESSPHLFLSCSEDGEVRQWDLRQPSAAYPYPRNRNGWASVTEDNDSGVPPPLISYKRYNLDINTISCSGSQPHYIALGGAHLHCFLHDRRMLGRDRHYERGLRTGSAGSSDHDNNLMSEATQCVRRFAPNGQAKMKAHSTGHITACKISDANPNELIASWSGDSIYGFDLVRSPDAREEQSSPVEAGSKRSANGRVKTSRDRKRKRSWRPEISGQTRRRQEALGRELCRDDDDVALRVRYENGQSESIPIRQAERDPVAPGDSAESSVSEADRIPDHIADTSVEIRKKIFTLSDPGELSDQDPTGHGRSFTSALGSAASILDNIDDIMRTWRYPVDPDDSDVLFQTTLRRHREATRRFIQAAGTISRVLGGKLQTPGGQHPMMSSFVHVELAPNESGILDESEQFRYDFVKAICLWLDSGPGAVVEGFTGRRRHARFPIQEDASIESIDEVIIPYLLRMASDTPVMNVDVSRFEVDENRQIFASEKAAVLAFAGAIKIPFEDLSRADPDLTDEHPQSQNRRTALRFWGMKVARGLLLKAAEGVTHSYVGQAFGGDGRTPALVRREEARQIAQTRIDPDEEDPIVEAISVGVVSQHATAEAQAFDEDMIPINTANAAVYTTHPQTSRLEADQEDPEEEEEEEEDEADSITNEADASSSEDEDDSSEPDEEPLYRYRGGGRTRHTVHPETPCIPHHRIYTGHCNVKTVKDVNFYGLHDEYVVSGSDDGNLFIWDRQSAELINILEGDGEVVNVVQGHPYEPMLAVSGIDSTVKIFGCDATARRDAYRGVGVSASDERNFSSLNFRMRRRADQRAQRAQSSQELDEGRLVVGGWPRDMDMNTEPAVSRASKHVDAYYFEDDSDNPDRPPAPENGLASRKRMKDAYRITAENDANKRSGQRDTFITRSMLAQLAARMGVTIRPQGGGDGDENGDGGPVMMVGGPDGEQVVMGDDCAVM